MFGVGAAVSALIAGFVSDRFHTRRTLQILASVFYIVSGTVFYFVGNYYQLLLFRLIDGLAAGVSCTMLYTTVGDVYSAGLLGFKVAIIYFCNNIGYTIGPICGQKLFEISGIPGTAAMVIALGLLELLLLLTIVDDSLKIKQYVVSREARLPESTLNNYIALSPLDSGAGAGRTDKDDTAKQLLSESESPKVNINPNQDGKPDTPLWKFMLRLPVIASTLSIIASIGIQCTLDTLIPLHLIDKFQRSDSGGVTFVIYGLALTVFVPVVGKLNNWLIKRCGEQMRYYIMASGSLVTLLAVLIMALASTYTGLMVGYVVLAFSNLCMYIPAQSAYGDLVNYAKADLMAQCYSLSIIAWAVSAIVFTQIGTALYSTVGFTKAIIICAVFSCTLCACICLAYPLRNCKTTENT